MFIINRLLIVNDPIEQFEAIVFKMLGFTTALLVLFLAFLVLTLVFSQSGKTNIVGFIIEKSFKFISSEVFSILGKKHGQYVYTYYFLFMFLLINNLIGLTPWSFTLTSYFIIPLFFSFLSVTGAVVTGWEIRGYRFFNILSPGSVPKIIFHFLIYIEFVSYIMRIFSLAIRLFANMVAGHALIKILTGFTFKLCSYSGWTLVLGIAVTCLILAILFLEILIAGLQSYVFVFLSLIYLSEVID